MMTFYAAAGSYQIRSEDGKNMPYIMRLGKLQPVSIPEFSLWSMLSGITGSCLDIQGQASRVETYRVDLLDLFGTENAKTEPQKKYRQDEK